MEFEWYLHQLQKLKFPYQYLDILHRCIHILHNHGGSGGHGYVKYEYNGVEYKDIDMEILTSVTDGDTIQIPIKKDNPEVLGNVDLLITADIVFWIVTAILLIPLGFSIRNFVDRKEQKVK